MPLIDPELHGWKTNRLTSGPYHVELVGQWMLPQVCGPGGVVGLSGPDGAVFQASEEQAIELCRAANAGELERC